jgi:hypothetical protein
MRLPNLALTLLVAFAIGSLIPLNVGAARVSVTYELSGTFGTFLSGPLGPLGTGQTTVAYEAANGLRIAPGPIHVQSFRFAQSVSATLFGDVLTGAMALSASASAPGTLTTGGLVSVYPAMGSLTGNLHCSGATCFLVGLTPSVTNPLTTPLAGIFAGGTLSGTAGPLNLFATIGTFGGVPLTINITGLEVNRGRFTGQPDLVSVCHKGAPISVAEPAVAAHLGHGDIAGDCGSVQGALTPCGGGASDVWEFSVDAGQTITLAADTVDAATAADLFLFGSCASGDSFSGDDDFACTFPPPAFACPAATFVASASSTCTVSVSSFGSCADLGTANYLLTVEGDGAGLPLTLVGDDI